MYIICILYLKAVRRGIGRLPRVYCGYVISAGIVRQKLGRRALRPLGNVFFPPIETVSITSPKKTGLAKKSTHVGRTGICRAVSDLGPTQTRGSKKPIFFFIRFCTIFSLQN